MNVIEVLRDSELFRGLDPDRLKTVAAMCRGRSVAKDSMIFTEGDEADELYVLESGRVILEMELQPFPEAPVIPTPLELVDKSHCFGWSAIVEPYAYTLSARCMTNSTVLGIKGSRLRDQMEQDPILGSQVMQALAELIARRLADTRLRLSNGLGMILHSQEVEVGG